MVVAELAVMSAVWPSAPSSPAPAVASRYATSGQAVPDHGHRRVRSRRGRRASAESARCSGAGDGPQLPASRSSRGGFQGHRGQHPWRVHRTRSYSSSASHPASRSSPPSRSLTSSWVSSASVHGSSCPPTAASSSLAEPDEARSCSRNELKPTSSFGDDRDRCETGHGLMLNANHRLVVVDQARTRPPSWTACSTPELSMQHDQAARPDAAWSRRPKVIRADRPAQTAAMPKRASC
jgi:hypothetical protein